MDNVIEKIKDLMKTKGYSQPKLAELAGVSFQTLNNNLTGRTPMTSKTTEKVLAVFGLSPFDIQEENASVLNTSVRGYLEYNGEIKRINSFKDAENFVKKYREEVIELPKRAKSIIALNSKNAKKAEERPNVIDYSFLYDEDGNYDLQKVEDWLNREEEYDATTFNCWSFKVSQDVRNGLSLALGNQVGIPYDMLGIHFFTNENAYLAGQFSLPGEQYQRVQRRIIETPNGYTAKKYVRNEYNDLIRPDWNDLRTNWMRYCLWNKCLYNEDFRKMLLAIPSTAILIEQGTTENTGGFWGCHNPELKEARDVIERYTRATTSKKVEDAVFLETNKINCIGSFKGCNCMGKCLMLCKIALETGNEPPIDYDLLRSKNIYLLGKLLTFDGILNNRNSNL